MGIIDVVLLVIIGITAFRGFMKGLVMEVFSFIALMVGFWAAYVYSGKVAKGIDAFGFTKVTDQALGYVFAFILAYVVMIFAGTFLSKMFKEVKLGWVNQGGGAVFGGFKSAAIMGLMLSTLSTTLPSDSEVVKQIATGPVSSKLAEFAPLVYDGMNKIPDSKKNNPFNTENIKAVQETIEKVDPSKIKNAITKTEDAANSVNEASKEADKVQKGADDIQNSDKENSQDKTDKQKEASDKELQQDFNKN